MTRAWRVSIIVTVCVVTFIKLYLALTTEGSADVIGYADCLAKIREFGGIGAYYVRGPFNNPFNNPPFIICNLKAVDFLARATGLPFGFWLRLPSILADIGSLFIVWRLLESLANAATFAFPFIAACHLSSLSDGLRFSWQQ